MTRSTAKKRSVELLAAVGIPAPEQRLKQYPHQLSGGMRQRVAIAIALSCEPKLLIADKPTTALDVTIQTQILDLLAREQRRRHMAIILITHDLGVVAGRTDEVAVMYAGRVVERAPTPALFNIMRMPYTEALLAALSCRPGRPAARSLLADRRARPISAPGPHGRAPAADALIAPPLLWLSAPVAPLLLGLPRPVRSAVARAGRGSRPPAARDPREPRGEPGRIHHHVLDLARPRPLRVALSSDVWHHVEHATFLSTSLLFWRPVVLAWPARSPWPRLAMIPYLIVADFQNTVLAALLTFSDHVIYPSYQAVARPRRHLRARRPGHRRRDHVDPRLDPVPPPGSVSGDRGPRRAGTAKRAAAAGGGSAEPHGTVTRPAPTLKERLFGLTGKKGHNT